MPVVCNTLSNKGPEKKDLAGGKMQEEPELLGTAPTPKEPQEGYIKHGEIVQDVHHFP